MYFKIKVVKWSIVYYILEMLIWNMLLIWGFFFYSEGMIYFFWGVGVGWLVGGCLLKINIFKNGNVIGFVLVVYLYERKCMYWKFERMLNKKLMKFELFKIVFCKLLLEDNLDMNYFYFIIFVILICY